MRERKSFAEDERAIEGLPIRLVIALVVGVASLAVMMNMLGGIGSPGETEVQVQMDPPVVKEGKDVTVKLVNEKGERLSGFDGKPFVVISDGTATITSGVIKKELGSDGKASVPISDIEFAPGQDEGKLEVSIALPSKSKFVDKDDQKITVVK